MSDKTNNQNPQDKLSHNHTADTDENKEDLLENTITEVVHFFSDEQHKINPDHRDLYKDEDGCARYDDLWGG